MKWITRSGFLLLYLATSFAFAQSEENPLGQVITIETRLHSFIGKPIWSLIIRDVDHNQNIPYLFDIRKGNNHWVIFTYSRNYMILSSSLQIETYQPRYNKYRNYRLTNFCNLESNGRIMRGESMNIILEDNLTPYSDTHSCIVTAWPEDNFFIYQDPE